MRPTVVAAIGCLAVVPLVAAPQIVFRSTVESVAVDVSVEQAGRAVADLSASDFEIRDNGVAQRVLDVTREALPIDVTFVIDLSGSVGEGTLLESLTGAVRVIGARLRPIDRSRVLTFNDHIQEVRPLTAGRLPDPFDLGRPAGKTSLFDAVALALVSPPETGRRRMTMIFTDGIDSSSFVDGPDLIELARRADSAVFTVAATSGPSGTRAVAPHAALFEAIADATGGMAVALGEGQDLGTSFTDAFERFRTSYVLRYTPEGPARPGWHTLAVRVTRRGTFDVRARQGYFVSASLNTEVR